MDSYPLAWRVAAAQLLGAMLLCLGVLGGPADTLARALAVGSCAGFGASALAGFRFPGWPWFSAGLACCWTGLMRQQLHSADWSSQLLLASAALIAYILVWPLSQAVLIHVFGVETQDYESPWNEDDEDQPPFILRGPLVALLTSLAGVIVLLGLGNTSPWFAAPVWVGLAFWSGHAFPDMRPEWPLVGTICSLGLLSALQSSWIDSLVQPILRSQDAFWLLGQACAFTTLGYWLSLWRIGSE